MHTTNSFKFNPNEKMWEIHKVASSTLDYVHDWTRWLAGDIIATSDWSITPNDGSMTVTDDQQTNTLATVWLSGGKVGASYTVTNNVLTGIGRIVSRSFTVKVVERLSG